MTDTITPPTTVSGPKPEMTREVEPLALRGTVIRRRSFSVRLDPRTIVVCVALSVVTVVVGAAFGMSGAIFQALVRNPLGSPDIIGFNAGAALGAVMMIVLFGGSAVQVSIGAVLGGLVTALAVYVLAWKRGVQAYRLVLVGIGIGFTVSAVIDYLLTRAEINDVQRAAVWLTGSLNGRGWDEVRIVALALLVLGPLAIVMQRTLDRLDLGDVTAAALGVNVGRSKLALVLVGVSLSALGVAAAGPIAFVAFVAGPVARRLVNSPRACIVPAAFVGALLTVVADLAARRLLAPPRSCRWGS